KVRTPTAADSRVRHAVKLALTHPRPNAFAAAWALLFDALPHELQAAYDRIGKKLGVRPSRAPDDPEEMDLKRRFAGGARKTRTPWLENGGVRAELERRMDDAAASLRAVDGYKSAVAKAVNAGNVESAPRRGRGRPRRLPDAIVHGLYTRRLEANRRDR